MTLARDRLASAVRVALSLGLFAHLGTAPAQDAVVVTGSNIPRTDAHSASPLTVLDRASIARSGKLTLGDLLQDLPAMSGPLTNPRVNIGGGTGASNVSLHGLGGARTLLLVNGHRVLNADLNAIPANAVERIEVLGSGAAAVYGSDAVAGVVNCILRADYQGAEFATQFGISDHNDAPRRGYQFVFGQSTDKGSILAGVGYNQFDAVLAGNRKFSRNAIYYYYGAGHISPGSSHTPTGQVQLPPSLKAIFGCDRVTLRQLGLSGASLADYKCYTAADAYNFQANGNFDLTPQERSNAFLVGNYKLSDAVQAYVEFYHDKTNAASSLPAQLADTLTTPFQISADSYYNPFGVAFGGSSNRFKTRTIGNGNRVTSNVTQTDQLTSGLRGSFGDSWQWNLYFNYGHFARLTHTNGYVNVNRLGAALGPSYQDVAGNIVCGTPATGPIAGCTPVDLFNILDPGTIAALDRTGGNTFTNIVGLQRSEVAEINGDVMELPAGSAKLAAGVSHRRESLRTNRDATEIPDASGNCDIGLDGTGFGGTGCVASLDGAYSVREVYAEVLLPLLKDLPFARALNLDVAARHSHYSSFGSTNNASIAIEWRASEELSLRASVADVFRVPSITELYHGSTLTFASINDPCFSVSSPHVGCQYLPPGGLPRYPDIPYVSGMNSGAATAGLLLRPEHGRSFNYSAAYDSQRIPGLALNIDLWRVQMRDLIRQVSAQDVVDECFYAGDSALCPLIHRYPDGFSQGFLETVQTPYANLGTLDAAGVDLGGTYRIPETRLGGFSLGLRATYLDRYDINYAPGLPNRLTRELAGHYTTPADPIPNANFARWRALASVDWNFARWSAAWTAKYIGHFTVGYANLLYSESACLDYAPPGCEFKYGASVYHNVTAGYGIEPINAHIDVGIDNVFDKQPQILYLNNAPNGNVDVNTFDTVGRFYWARLSLKF